MFTTQEILIAVFGLPTLILVGGVYYRMGQLVVSNEFLKKQFEDVAVEFRSVWGEINKLKEKV